MEEITLAGHLGPEERDHYLKYRRFPHIAYTEHHIAITLENALQPVELQDQALSSEDPLIDHRALLRSNLEQIVNEDAIHDAMKSQKWVIKRSTADLLKSATSKWRVKPIAEQLGVLKIGDEVNPYPLRLRPIITVLSFKNREAAHTQHRSNPLPSHPSDLTNPESSHYCLTDIDIIETINPKLDIDLILNLKPRITAAQASSLLETRRLMGERMKRAQARFGATVKDAAIWAEWDMKYEEKRRSMPRPIVPPLSPLISKSHISVLSLPVQADQIDNEDIPHVGRTELAQSIAMAQGHVRSTDEYGTHELDMLGDYDLPKASHWLQKHTLEFPIQADSAARDLDPAEWVKPIQNDRLALCTPLRRAAPTPQLRHHESLVRGTPHSHSRPNHIGGTYMADRQYAVPEHVYEDDQDRRVEEWEEDTWHRNGVNDPSHQANKGQQWIQEVGPQSVQFHGPPYPVDPSPHAQYGDYDTPAIMNERDQAWEGNEGEDDTWHAADDGHPRYQANNKQQWSQQNSRSHEPQYDIDPSPYAEFGDCLPDSIWPQLDSWPMRSSEEGQASTRTSNDLSAVDEVIDYSPGFGRSLLPLPSLPAQESRRRARKRPTSPDLDAIVAKKAKLDFGSRVTNFSTATEAFDTTTRLAEFAATQSGRLPPSISRIGQLDRGVRLLEPEINQPSPIVKQHWRLNPLVQNAKWYDRVVTNPLSKTPTLVKTVLATIQFMQNVPLATALKKQQFDILDEDRSTLSGVDLALHPAAGILFRPLSHLVSHAGELIDDITTATIHYTRVIVIFEVKSYAIKHTDSDVIPSKDADPLTPGIIRALAMFIDTIAHMGEQRRSIVNGAKQGEVKVAFGLNGAGEVARVVRAMADHHPQNPMLDPDCVWLEGASMEEEHTLESRFFVNLFAARAILSLFSPFDEYISQWTDDEAKDNLGPVIGPELAHRLVQARMAAGRSGGSMSSEM